MFGDADLGYVNLNGSDPVAKIGTKKKTGGFVDGMLFWWGIVFPLGALVLESNAHFCAKQFFDPLPTSGHAMLFALIPVTNFLAWASLRWDMSPHFAFMLFCNGMAVGVAILYTLMFLPITHISMLGVFYFGLGLLGLAPLLSLISLIKGGSLLAKSSQSATYVNGHHVKHLGHLLVLTLVIAVETPSTFTRVALGMASKPETRQQGLDLLRAFGSQEVMLRACYERSGRATDIVGSLYESHDPLPVEKARDLFYRVTGRTFNSFPIPESARATMRNAGFLQDDGIEGAVDDEFDLDPDIAGEMVSGVSRGLSVSKSDLSGTVDANAAIAKFDWYLDFKNKSKFEREVRTRIKLPHGGVVNKASLIVNGKEYEASITVRSLAREIYRQAVAQKKNPLLVSTTGTDSVLVQVFPVPPSNLREVKLHLGVVAPLELDRQRQGVVVLPQFEERNFQLSAPHNIALTSSGELKADFKDLKVAKDEQGGKITLSGSLDPSKLASGDGIIHASRNPAATSFTAADTWQGVGHIALEKIEEVNAVAPRKLIAVIDGSGTMGTSINAIADSFNNLPDETELSVYFVRDDKKEHLTGNRGEVINQLKQLPCSGGQIDGQELLDALQESWSSDSSVLWIHGAQPVESPYKTAIQSIIKSAGNRTLLYDMQILSGPNQILDGMESVASIQTLPHTGQIEEDLKLLFDGWSNKVKPYRIVRSQMAPEVAIASTSPNNKAVGDLVYSTFDDNAPPSVVKPATVSGAAPTMSDLAQLMAYDRVLQDMRANTYQSKQDAINLAARYHIVTPMSSAVLVTEVPELNCSAELSRQRNQSIDITQRFANLFSRENTDNTIGEINRQLSSINEPMEQMNSREMITSYQRKKSQQSALRDGEDRPTPPTPAPAAPSMSSPARSIGCGRSNSLNKEAEFKAKDSEARSNEAVNKQEMDEKSSASFGASSGLASPSVVGKLGAKIAGGGGSAEAGASDKLDAPAEESLAAATADGNNSGSLDDINVASSKKEDASGAFAPLVPESDTYLLLAAAMGILAAVVLRNRLLTAKKA